MHHVSERRDHRLIAMGSALIALAFVVALAFAARAQAAETLYWDNYSASTIGSSDITGGGGSLLNLTGVELDNPEGMAYDTVTNRLFVASPGTGEKGAIVFVKLDGSGASVFSPSGTVVEDPLGVALDPTTRMLYWVNSEGTGSIGYANIDTGVGGLLNTNGATLADPYRIALDPVSGRVFWANEEPEPEIISYANTNGSGGGNLDTTGATPPEGIDGLTVDSVNHRLYWVDDNVSFASTTGGSGGDLDITGSAFKNPYGMAVDPSIGRVFWANYGNNKEAANAFGFASTAGGSGGSISIASVPVDGPQDPVILKSPTGIGTPVITRDPKNPAVLTCPTGSWGSDYPGGSVYQAPRSYGYQWLLNGAGIPGATASTFTATNQGSYTCTVTATNQTGSATQTSGGVNVKPSKVKLTVKPKTAKVKAGKTATFNVKALNQGDLRTKNARVCVKVPNKAKKFLKAKCKSIGKVTARKTKTTKLKVKVKPDAVGSYKIKIQIKGASGKVAKGTIKIIG
jgi:hypothetical protein